MNEKKEVIFRAENLQTWFPITKGPFKKVVGHVKAVDGVDIEVGGGIEGRGGVEGGGEGGVVLGGGGVWVGLGRMWRWGWGR